MTNWFLFALSAPLLWAITNHVDKYVVSKIGNEMGVRGIVTFSTLFGGVILLFVGIFANGIGSITGFARLILILSGMIGSGMLFFYILALQLSEATIVVAFMQLIPIFSYILGAIFFHEVFTFRQVIAAVIIIIGSAIMSIDFEAKEHNRFRKKVVVFMVLGSLCFALNETLFKAVAVPDIFWASTFWQYVGIFLTGIILFLIPVFRKDFLVIFRNNSTKLFKLISIIELMTILGNLATAYAVILAPLALVMLVASFQPAFVFIFGIIITLFLPKGIAERISKVSIIQKVSAIALILVGSYILYF